MTIDRIKRLIFGDQRDPRVVLESVFPGVNGEATAVEQGTAWGAKQLDAAGISAADRPVEAIRHLRSAEPGLDLKPARYLVHQISLRPRTRAT